MTDETLERAAREVMRVVDACGMEASRAVFVTALQAAAPLLEAPLRLEVERLTGERDRWMETAAQNQRNADFYRDLVIAVGRLLGPEVYRCDDGAMAQDVLCLKVPEVAADQLATLRQRVQEGDAMRDGAIKRARGFLDAVGRAEAKLAQVEARNTKLREALRRFGEHEAICATGLGPGRDCDCEFGAALADHQEGE